MDRLLYDMKKGNFNMTNGIWRDVHITLKMLMKKLLLFNPQDRISIYEVQKDSWILFWDIKSLMNTPRLSMRESITRSNDESSKLIPRSYNTKKNSLQNLNKMNSSAKLDTKEPITLDYSKSEVSLIMGHSTLVHSYAVPQRNFQRKVTLTNLDPNNSVMMSKLAQSKFVGVSDKN
jgi:hypothetical protein